MGYRSVLGAPRMCLTFAEAKKIHDTTKPIRGQEVRPLAARKEWREYSVRMNAEAVEFVAFKHPVITYHANGDIVVQSSGGGYLAARQLVGQVLGINMEYSRGKDILTDHLGGKYVLGGKESAVLRIVSQQNGAGVWTNKLCVAHAPQQYGYVVNRKAANAVRARYSEFRQYLRAFISLREHTVTRYGVQVPAISYTLEEALNALGVENADPKKKPAIDNRVGRVLASFPQRPYRFTAPTPTNYYETAFARFNAMCTNDQPQETKTENFYKAVMQMLVEGWHVDDFTDPEALSKVYTIQNHDLWEYFDKLSQMMNRHEILEKKQLKQGQVPNATYEKWMMVE